MLKKHRNYAIIIMIILILSIPLQVNATVPVSSGYEGPESIVFISMHYEDMSAIEPLQVKLEQDLIALEHVFKTLQTEGKLDSDYPRLAIIASKYFEVDRRFGTIPTVLFFTNSATFVCNNPDLLQFEPRGLGPAYVIHTNTGLLNYSDIVAMMLLMSELSDQSPNITISYEEDLDAGKMHIDYERLMNLNVKHEEYPDPTGEYRIIAEWRAQAMHYLLLDMQDNVVHDFKSPGIYKGTPSWAPVERPDFHGRILAYASSDQAIIYDIIKERYHTLNLDFTFEDPSIQELFDIYDGVQRVRFAMHSTENKVYVLPYAANAFYISAVYSLDLDTGEWFRELENYTLISEVWENIYNAVWISFIPAVPDRKILNVDILSEPWATGQNAPKFNIEDEQAVIEEQPNEPEPILEEEPVTTPENEPILDEEDADGPRNAQVYLWLLLIIPVAGLVYLILKKGKKRS